MVEEGFRFVMASFIKRIFQAAFWVIVIAIAAALPWLVQDWMSQDSAAPSSTPPASVGGASPLVAEDPPETTNGDTPVAETSAPEVPSRSIGEKVSQFLQLTWLKVQGSEDENAGTGMVSERSEEAASRIGPALETELTEKQLSLGLPLFLRVFKEESELEVWMEPAPGQDFVLFKTYPICAWSGDLGPKLKEGDRQSPEGFYFVPPARMNPDSRFHLSFDLGFPNEYDQHHDRTGTYLMIHGDCVSIGCYAMTDEAIEEIYTLAVAALQNGQSFFRVHSFPFRMSDERMDSLDEEGEWFAFWSNLKEGYDYFEFLHRPPNVTVIDGKYHFQ